MCGNGHLTHFETRRKPNGCLPYVDIYGGSDYCIMVLASLRAIFVMGGTELVLSPHKMKCGKLTALVLTISRLVVEFQVFLNLQGLDEGFYFYFKGKGALASHTTGWQV